MTLILQTPRLHLREILPSDAESCYRLNADPEVLRYTGDDPFESIAMAERFLTLYDHYRKYGYGRWAVIRQEDNEFLGWCGLKYHPDTDEVDLGFRLMQKYWNKGYATEASLACLEYGFGTLNMNRIIGRVAPPNLGSRRVLEKCGMTYLKTGQEDGHEWMIYETVRG